MLDPLPSAKDQIREQTTGVAASLIKRLPLWAIVFGAAALTWWQIDRLTGIAGGLLEGQGWERGRMGLALLLATLGVVLAVGFSVITIMATDWFSAVLCAALLFAPMALFHQWEPLWIWWTLGPLAALILVNFIVIRSDIHRQLSWRPLRAIVGATLWVMILIAGAAPLLTAQLLHGRQDSLRPEDFRPVAERLVNRLPTEVIDFLLDELPRLAEEAQAMPPQDLGNLLPVTPVVPPSQPGAWGNPMSRSKMPPVAIKQVTPPGTGPQPITAAPAWGQPVTPAPASPAPAWGQPVQGWGQPAPAVTPPAPAVEPPAVTAPPMTAAPVSPTAERRRSAADDRRIDQLATGLWNAISTRGSRYADFPPLLSAAGAFAVFLAMIPLTIIAVAASVVLVGFALALLRAMGYVNLVTVRVEVPRYTLRGLRFRDDGETPAE